jgi:hypothetical protein
MKDKRGGVSFQDRGTPGSPVRVAGRPAKTTDLTPGNKTKGLRVRLIEDKPLKFDPQGVR